MRRSSCKPRGGDLKARIATLKSKLDFDDVVSALDLVADGAAHADCPHKQCRADSSLRSCHEGQGYYCAVCGEKGDIVGLVLARRDRGLYDAVKVLEGMVPAIKENETGRLL